MQLLVDSYIPGEVKGGELTKAKAEGMADIIPIPYVQTYSREWMPGGETQLSGVGNFQNLFVYAPTTASSNGGANGSITNAPWVATLGALSAQQTRAMSASFNNTFSQWLPFSTPISQFAPTAALIAATYSPVTAAYPTGASSLSNLGTGLNPIKCAMQFDIMAHRARDCVAPLNTFKVISGRYSSPLNPVITSFNFGPLGAYIWDGSQMYYEHQKVQDRVANHVFSAAIPDDVFNTTMPHAMITPNPNGPPTRNNKDTVLRVQFQGGSTSYLPTLRFVLTTYRVLRIEANGEIKEND
jgi:hypothetical protein